ncbi:MAG: 3-phosphoshikimate 1-carboxyvinyltransferase [Prevotella sp.]|nr:3-phosphoshikimate 1-carboxyvinyltransferase [Prevotella sp.]
MVYHLTARRLQGGLIHLPASKSITNRALIISALSGQKGGLENVGRCDDTEVMIAALRDRPPVVDIGAAGSAMRFLTAYFSIQEGEHVLTGTPRMCHRPIGVLVDALRRLGADISYVGREGFPPLRIRGKRIAGGAVEMAGDVSSQYISSLLMIAPTMAEGLTIHLLGDVVSRSYIDITLSMMQFYGASAEWAGVDTIVVKAFPYVPRHYFIENDWTAASYWYEAVALAKNKGAEIRLDGLTDGSTQGDTIVKYIFSLLGVRTSFKDKTKKVPTEVSLRGGGMVVSRLVFDFRHCPDLVQTVVCTCCGLGIPFEFSGLSTLRIKETDRIIALKAEMRKLGFVLYDDGEGRLVWDGERTTPTMEPIDTYEDHRMAMSFAPLALRMDGIRIVRPEVVSKSYPDFWEHLRQLSFVIDEA